MLRAEIVIRCGLKICSRPGGNWELAEERWRRCCKGQGSETRWPDKLQISPLRCALVEMTIFFSRCFSAGGCFAVCFRRDFRVGISFRMLPQPLLHLQPNGVNSSY